MSKYDDLTQRLLERRKQYVAARSKRNKVLAGTAASLCVVALVGVAVWQGGDLLTQPAPIKVADTTTGGTTVTTAPTVTTPTTDGGVVPPVNTTTSAVAPSRTEPSGETAASRPTATQPQPTVTQSKPTATQSKPTAPTKTEPSKTMTQTQPTVPDNKVLVVADKIDNTGNFNEAEMSIKKKYISRRLKEAMAYYEGEDYYKGGDTVVYAVIVSMPMMKEYGEDFWNSNEEWAQVLKEQDEAYNAWYTEAKQVNPSWDEISDDIEWTDTMRANYERWLALIDERNSIQSEYYRPYVQTCIDQRFEALKVVSGIEPVDILEDSFYTHNAYYVELTADAINALAKHGGYTFSLAMANQRDYSGYWVGVE